MFFYIHMRIKRQDYSFVTLIITRIVSNEDDEDSIISNGAPYRIFASDFV